MPPGNASSAAACCTRSAPQPSARDAKSTSGSGRGPRRQVWLRCQRNSYESRPATAPSDRASRAGIVQGNQAAVPAARLLPLPARPPGCWPGQRRSREARAGCGCAPALAPRPGCAAASASRHSRDPRPSKRPLSLRRQRFRMQLCAYMGRLPASQLPPRERPSMKPHRNPRPFSLHSKYYPLHAYLSQLGGTSQVDMEFSHLEQVLGQPLPIGARSHRAWWANGQSGHSQSRAWLLAGWRIGNVDLTRERVTFERTP